MTTGDRGRRDRSPSAGGPRDASYDWRRPRQQTVQPLRRSWTSRVTSLGGQLRQRVAFLFVCLLVLLGTLIYWLVVWHEKTTLVAVALTQYDDRWPLNALAQEDVERLAQVNPENLDGQTSVTWSSKKREEFLDEFKKQAEGLPPGGPNGNVVLIYLSVHGNVNKEGQPCLLTSDADPLNCATWLPLAEVLKTLKEKTTSNPKLIKVLFLDCNRFLSHWPSGTLYNGFADQLPNTVRAVDDPNLVVINSTGPGQMGWFAPELGGSVFGYFVARGLEGDANADGNQEISLGELESYLARNVKSWCRTHRDAVQIPQRVRTSDDDLADLPLVYSTGRDREAETQRYAPSERSRFENDVRELWVLHDAKLKATPPPYRYQPAKWAHIEQQLLRLEEALLAGKAYEGVLNKWGNVKNELAEFDKNSGEKKEGLPSLSLAARFGGDGLEHQSPPTEAFKLWRESRTAPKPPMPPAPVPPKPPTSTPKTPEEALRSVWHWAAGQSELDRKTLADQALPFLLRESPQAPLGYPPPLELEFLKLLDKHLDWGQENPNLKELQQAVPAAIKLRALAEVAANPADERVVHWVQPLVDEADTSRRRAEDQLFTGDQESLKNASIVRGQAGTGYAGAETLAQLAANAYHVRDEVFYKLPYLAVWQSIGGRPSAQNLPTIDSILARTRNLSRLLEDGELSLDDRGLVENLQSDLTRALGAYDKECVSLKTDFPKSEHSDKSAPDPRFIRRLIESLSVPLVTGDQDRNNLHGRLVEELLPITPSDTTDIAAEKSMAAATSAASTKESSAAAGAASGAKPSAAGPESETFKLVSAKEHPALTLLNLSGFSVGNNEGGSIPLTPPQVDQRLNSNPVEALADLGGTLRQRAREAVDVAKGRVSAIVASAAQGEEDRARGTGMRNALSQADRVVRCVSWMDAGAGRDMIGGEPAQQLRQLDWSYLLEWHGTRFANDFWAGSPRTDDSPDKFYFQAAADACFAAAKSCTPEGVKPPSWNTLWRGDEAPRAYLKSRVAAADEIRIPRKTTRATDSIVTVDPKVPKDFPVGDSSVYFQPQNGLVFAGESPVGVRRVRWPTPAAAEATAVAGPRIPIKAGQTLSVETLFRGHTWLCKVIGPPPAAGPEGWQALFLRPETGPAHIRVTGAPEQGVQAVFFVLDCSGSMNETLPAPDQSLATPPEKRRGGLRMKRAKESLMAVLNKLNDENSARRYRVGLIAYGHRYGYELSPDRRPQYLIRNPGPGEEASLETEPSRDKHPDYDVEELSKLVPLDEHARAEFTRLLHTLEPFGHTPLFRSARLAIENICQDANDDVVSRHIIVITDGMNRVMRSANDMSYQEVRDTLRNNNREGKNVSVSFIGLAMDAAEERQLTDKIAAHPDSHVQYKRVTDFGDFVYGLLQPEATVHYEVALGNTAARGKWPFGKQMRSLPSEEWPTTAKLSVISVPKSGGADPAEATLAEKSLRLFGGEQIGLKYVPESATKGTLVPEENDTIKPYNPQTLENQGEGEPQKLDVAVRHVEREGDAAIFHIMLQNSEKKQLTPRPTQVWATITPQSPSSPAYETGYVAYVPNEPIPRFKVRYPKWPRSSQAAELVISLRFGNPVAPAQEISLPPGGELERYGLRLVRTSKTGAPYELQVTCENTLRDRSFIDLNLPAARISRREAEGQTTVSFLFLSDDPEPKQLRLFTRDSLKSNSNFVYRAEVAVKPQ